MDHIIHESIDTWQLNKFIRNIKFYTQIIPRNATFLVLKVIKGSESVFPESWGYWKKTIHIKKGSITILGMRNKKWHLKVQCDIILFLSAKAYVYSYDYNYNWFLSIEELYSIAEIFQENHFLRDIKYCKYYISRRENLYYTFFEKSILHFPHISNRMTLQKNDFLWGERCNNLSPFLPMRNNRFSNDMGGLLSLYSLNKRKVL